MGFETLAKDLLRTNGPKLDSTGVQAELDRAGFSRAEIFQEMRSIVDDPETNSGVKKAVLELATKLHGLLKDDSDTRQAPTIVLQISGGSTIQNSDEKLNIMLNPSLSMPTGLIQ